MGERPFVYSWLEFVDGRSRQGALICIDHAQRAASGDEIKIVERK
jgi:hypothetical protein